MANAHSAYLTYPLACFNAQNAATLSYLTQSEYTLTVNVISSAGTQASAPVSVIVREVRDRFGSPAT